MQIQLEAKTKTLRSIKADSNLIQDSNFPSGSLGKESACEYRSIGDLGSILGLGIFLGGGNGYPLLYFCWDNPMDRRSL